jgi:NTE family protein
MTDPSPPRAARRARQTQAHASSAPRTVDLALQGGGSHGAFTWGALDALLEDGRLTFDGISGTSAGAMNAAVLASGWAHGGPAGARQALTAFWHDVSGVAGLWGAVAELPLPPGMQAPAWLFNRDQWPAFAAWEAWMRLWSPYQLNPMNLGGLGDVVRRHVDVPALQRGPLKVFVTATSVRTGQPRVFSGKELSVDALLASACLPQIAQTVMIDGEPYWDGGFSGNPALWPLIYGTHTDDVLLVQINPRTHEGVPRTAIEINDRINEITFNASLVAEMRAIAFVQKLIEQGKLSLDEYKNLRLHRVADEEGLAPYDASSKLNTDPRLLQALFDLGRAAGERWLAAHRNDVGRRSSTEIAPVYLAPRQPAVR